MIPALLRWAAFGAALLLVATAAPGYVYLRDKATWAGPTIPIVLKLGTSATALRDGSLSFDQSMINAMMLWNEQIANVQFTWTEEPRTAKPKIDGVTTISFEQDVYGDSFGKNTLAITHIVTQGTRIVETDVMFNRPRWVFNSFFGYPEEYGMLQSVQDLHRIALHELGHTLGLDHPDAANQTVEAIMNSHVDDHLDHLAEDDIRGAQSLYGAAPNAPPATGNARMVNISTRGRVDTGHAAMIGGFIISGGPKEVLIRALGPSLPAPGVLADPLLRVA